MESTIVVTDYSSPVDSIREKLGKFKDVVFENYLDFQFSPQNFYILDLEMNHEQQVVKYIGQHGGKIRENYIPLWAHQSLLFDGDYSFIQLSRYIAGKYDVEYVATVLKGEKKLCCIYGNCQITILSRLLCSSKEFSDRYVMVQLPEVFKVEEYRHAYSDFIKFISYADLFIYQHVKKDNRFGEELSSDAVCSYLNKNCKLICFPNAYVGFYFPQIAKVKGERIPEATLMPYGDKLIQDNLKDYTFSELISAITSDSYYTPEYIQKYYESSVNELEEREKFCDVTISDYIFKHYKDKCLGYSPNHPINEVLEEVAKRILFKIEIVETGSLTSSLALNQFEMVIYPSVSKHLGLSFTKKTFVFNRKITPKPLSISEYVRYYLYYTNPTLFYGKLIDTDLSPALSVSKNVELLENKTILMQGKQVYLNVAFKIIQSGKIIIHLPRICCPARTICGVCHTQNGNYLVKNREDGHIEIMIDKERWAHLNLIYWVV